VERLVDIEAIHVSEPLVPLLVVAYPLGRFREHLRGEEVPLVKFVELTDVSDVMRPAGYFGIVHVYGSAIDLVEESLIG